jgi:hypothetical protein
LIIDKMQFEILNLDLKLRDTANITQFLAVDN